MNEIATPGKRILAYLFDIILVYFLVSLIIGIRAINPTYDKYLEESEKYNELLKDFEDEKITAEEVANLSGDIAYNLNRYSISYNIVIVVVLIGYFVFFQKYNNGQTLGKKIMKIKIVSSLKDKNVSLLRYLLRSISTYYIMLGGIIPLVLNSILIFIIPKNSYMLVSSIINYAFFTISIVSLILLWARKNTIHDTLAKTKVINEN